MSDSQEKFLIVQEDILNKKTWKEYKNKKLVRETPIQELSDEKLQEAYLQSCGSQLHYHNKYMIFDILVEDFENEAERRGVTLVAFNSQFHRNRLKFKKRENVIISKH